MWINYFSQHPKQLAIWWIITFQRFKIAHFTGLRKITFKKACTSRLMSYFCK